MAEEPWQPRIAANRLIVKFVPERAEFGRWWVREFADARSIWISRRIPGLTVVQFPPALFEFVDDYLRTSARVEYVSYDWIGRRHGSIRVARRDGPVCDEFDPGPQENAPNDPLYPYQWHVNSTQQAPAIFAPCAWTVITRICPEIIIAVLDAGVLTDEKAENLACNPPVVVNSDIYPNLWQNVEEAKDHPNGIDDDENGYCDDLFGAGFFGEPPTGGCIVYECQELETGSVNCQNEHGDLITSIIGAVGNNGRAGTGIAWDCRIMTVRVFGDQGFTDSATLAGIEYALLHGARILNMSYSTDVPLPFSPDPIDDMIAGAEGEALFVCSAGNQGECIDFPGASRFRRPQNFNLPNMIVVASSTQNDARAQSSNWSSTYVHIAAPGHDIRVHYPQTCEGTPCQGTPCEFVTSGTSFAAPMVAAVAGFVWTLNPSFTPVQVKAQILNTARVHANWNEGNTCGQSGKWVVSGGILNAAAAVGAECDE